MSNSISLKFKDTQKTEKNLKNITNDLVRVCSESQKKR